MLPDAQRWLARTVDSFKERPSPLQASLLAPSSATPQLRTRSVLLTAAPLLLAIAGSALTPLPCAFSLAGVSGGTLLLIAIAIANDYTSVIMVRSASRLGGTGYEEVVLAAVSEDNVDAFQYASDELRADMAKCWVERMKQELKK